MADMIDQNLKLIADKRVNHGDKQLLVNNNANNNTLCENKQWGILTGKDKRVDENLFSQFSAKVNTHFRFINMLLTSHC